MYFQFERQSMCLMFKCSNQWQTQLFYWLILPRLSRAFLYPRDPSISFIFKYLGGPAKLPMSMVIIVFLNFKKRHVLNLSLNVPVVHCKRVQALGSRIKLFAVENSSFRLKSYRPSCKCCHCLPQNITALKQMLIRHEIQPVTTKPTKAQSPESPDKQKTFSFSFTW